MSPLSWSFLAITTLAVLIFSTTSAFFICSEPQRLSADKKFSSMNKTYKW